MTLSWYLKKNFFSATCVSDPAAATGRALHSEPADSHDDRRCQGTAVHGDYKEGRIFLPRHSILRESLVLGKLPDPELGWELLRPEFIVLFRELVDERGMALAKR